MPDEAAPKKRLGRKRSEADTTDREIRAARPRVTPRWWIVVMSSLMLLGLVWIVVFYLSSGAYPVPNWNNWNLVAGFGLVLVGFGMTTRWR